MSTTISRPKATAPYSRARGRRRETYVRPTFWNAVAARLGRTYELSLPELATAGIVLVFIDAIGFALITYA